MKIKNVLRPKKVAQPEVVVKEKIEEEVISAIVRIELFLHNRNSVNEKDLSFDLIRMTTCDVQQARKYISEMRRLGMQLMEGPMGVYDLFGFAEMRDYITSEEAREFFAKHLKDKATKKELESKFVEKYGSEKSKWSIETWDEYIDGMGQ